MHLLPTGLGISKIKVELDDLAFKYLEPEMYEELVTRIENGRVKVKNL